MVMKKGVRAWGGEVLTESVSVCVHKSEVLTECVFRHESARVWSCKHMCEITHLLRTRGRHGSVRITVKDISVCVLLTCVSLRGRKDGDDR